LQPELVTVHSATSNACTETAKQRFRAGCQSDYSNRFGLITQKRVKTPRGGVGVKSNRNCAIVQTRHWTATELL